jgi:hypothetical protein
VQSPTEALPVFANWFQNECTLQFLRGEALFGLSQLCHSS